MVQGSVSWAGAAAGTLDSAMAAHPTSGHQALQLPQLVLTTDTAALYRPPVPAAGKPSKDAGWLLLIHQIPPKPNYFRVKIWRRLQRLGAVGIKNSVYALPANEQAHEDLNWVLRDVVEGGGDASLVEARFVEGLSDEQVREMFRASRDADYLEIANEARELARKLPRKTDLSDERRAELEGRVARLQKRVAEVATVDFFLGRAREPLEGLLAELADRLASAPKVE